MKNLLRNPLNYITFVMALNFLYACKNEFGTNNAWWDGITEVQWLSKDSISEASNVIDTLQMIRERA